MKYSNKPQTSKFKLFPGWEDYVPSSLFRTPSVTGGAGLYES